MGNFKRERDITVNFYSRNWEPIYGELDLEKTLSL